jgi:hypothetical protein
MAIGYGSYGGDVLNFPILVTKTFTKTIRLLLSRSAERPTCQEMSRMRLRCSCHARSMPIVFFNAGGIIFYSDATDAAEDLIALTTLAAVRSFMASQLGQRIAQSLIDVLGDRIPGLVTAGVSGDEAELGDSLGIGGLIGSLGLI